MQRTHARSAVAATLESALVWIVPLLAGLVWDAPLGAQEIRGRVVDASSGVPVGLAGIFLLDRERELLVRAATDTEGYYRLEAPKPGEYHVFAQRLGYYENETPLLAVGEDGPYGVDIEMRPEPIRLDPLEVAVRNERLERFLTLELGVNPNSIFGYRVIQGVRLQEARLKARDNTDLLRWLYIPITHGRAVCINTGGRAFPERGGNRRMGERQCGKLTVDGFVVRNEHIESIDMDRIGVVVTLPGEVRLYTREFEWDFRRGRSR
jgi:hypothetical protein